MPVTAVLKVPLAGCCDPSTVVLFTTAVRVLTDVLPSKCPCNSKSEAVVAPLMVHLHLGSLHVVLQLHLWLSNPAELKA